MGLAWVQASLMPGVMRSSEEWLWLKESQEINISPQGTFKGGRSPLGVS